MSLLHIPKYLVKKVEFPLEEFNQLLSLGCGTPLPHKEFIPVHTLFAHLALNKPLEPAVIYKKNMITYGQLYTWAAQIAIEFSAKGIGPGNRVAIFIGPSTEMIVAVLGILLCGAAYVPLDINHPQQRISTTLTDANVSAILTVQNAQTEVEKYHLPIYTIENKPSNVVIDTAQLPGIAALTMDEPAYLIYTTGSIGEPKGVLVTHNQLTNSTLARHLIYPTVSTFLLVSPLAFDSSIAGIWGTLTTGGTLIIASSDEIRDPESLITLIEEYKVTQLLCIPSLYEILLEAAEKNHSTQIDTLNIITVAGEALHQSLVNRHFAFHKNAVELINEYGPTETTVWATYHRFNKQEPVSIGKPIPGTQLYVLDDNLQLIPQGEVGELFIGGSQVSQGYFRRPDLTKNAFITNPFTKEENTFMYRTGDFVKWNENGTLSFIGRRDHQVKVRGHRIELEAIEKAIQNLPNIRNVVVVVNQESTHLSAFVIATVKMTSAELRHQLSHTMPSAIVPTFIYLVDQFPLTSNGKVDRKTLQALAEKTQESSISASESTHDKIQIPENSLQQIIDQVTAAWSELLKLESVPTDVNFFDLGGHSLMVFKLQGALEKYTGKRLSVVSLFRHTTVLTQTELINNIHLSSETNSTPLRRTCNIQNQQQNI